MINLEFGMRKYVIASAVRQGAVEGSRAFLFATILFLSATSAFAWPWSGSGEKKASPEDQARIKDSLQMEEVRNLQREVDALTRIRLQKADSLEKLEAEHWRKRYAESQLTEEHQGESRELDARYSKLSTDLGRVSEEVSASKSLTEEAEEKAQSDESAYVEYAGKTLCRQDAWRRDGRLSCRHERPPDSPEAGFQRSREENAEYDWCRAELHG